MIAILMIFAASVALCMIFGKKLYETLPPSVFSVTLGVYLVALILPLRIAVYMCMGAIALLLVLAVLYRRKAGQNSPIPVDIDRSSTVPLCILAVVSIVFCALFCNRRVFFYDDLSYWALYTKNIFSIGKLPHLFENCSVNYKDYTPIIQILQYLAMFGRKTFSEPSLFRTNICFIYIMLLPVLAPLGSKDSKKDTKIAAALLYIIFPHILTSQFYYRLGVDLFLALSFGYVLYLIFLFDASGIGSAGQQSTDNSKSERLNRDEIFRLGCITVNLAFLALIKSSGIVLSLLAIIMFLICENLKRGYAGVAYGKKGLIPVLLKTAVILLFTLGSYFSWQLFLRYSWNNGYLSNRVKDGIKGGGFSLPPYTGEVIQNYVNHFFTYPLTRNRFGVTAFLLVIFIVAVYAVNIVNSRRSGEKTGMHTAMLVMSMSGLVIFCVAHISMYLFVFDEWEAYGLLEYDRYITQYLGGLFYLYVCLLLRVFACSGGKFKNMAGVVTAASLLIFIALLPYADIKEYLVPANYKAMFEKEYAQMAQAAADEWGSSGIREMNLAHDGTQRLTVIANAWDETTQFIEYEAVPQPIDRILNVPAVEEGKLADTIDDYLESYLYVARGAKASYVGNWQETAEFTEDNMPLLEGTLYRVNRLNDVKTLTPVHRNIGDFSY